MQKPLDDWSIVGMNHYHVAGRRMLFVAMTKDGRCIQEEGDDDQYVWNRLWHKAMQLVVPDDVVVTQSDVDQARAIVLECMGLDVLSGDLPATRRDRAHVYQRLGQVLSLLTGKVREG